MPSRPIPVASHTITQSCYNLPRRRPSADSAHARAPLSAVAVPNIRRRPRSRNVLCRRLPPCACLLPRCRKPLPSRSSPNSPALPPTTFPSLPRHSSQRCRSAAVSPTCVRLRAPWRAKSLQTTERPGCSESTRKQGEPCISLGRRSPKANALEPSPSLEMFRPAVGPSSPRPPPLRRGQGRLRLPRRPAAAAAAAQGR